MILALAYVDPGVGSLLVQALIGGTAGILVFLRYLWRTYVGRARSTVAPAAEPAPLKATK